jgi:hypothetical protein
VRSRTAVRSRSPGYLRSGPAGLRGGIVFGIVLLLLAVLIPKLAVLWFVGIIVLVVGLILAVLGTMGRAIGGRRHYY